MCVTWNTNAMRSDGVTSYRSTIPRAQAVGWRLNGGRPSAPQWSPTYKRPMSGEGGGSRRHACLEQSRSRTAPAAPGHALGASRRGCPARDDLAVSPPGEGRRENDRAGLGEHVAQFPGPPERGERVSGLAPSRERRESQGVALTPSATATQHSAPGSPHVAPNHSASDVRLDLGSSENVVSVPSSEMANTAPGLRSARSTANSQSVRAPECPLTNHVSSPGPGAAESPTGE